MTVQSRSVERKALLPPLLRMIVVSGKKIANGMITAR